MRLFFVIYRFKSIVLFGAFALFSSFSNVAAALDMQQAVEQVKALSCKNEQTVAQVLDSSVRRRSQRDLGWRTFQDEGYYDVERAVLINKGMELRYRWRVFSDGSIAPQSQRAENLCNTEDD